MTITRVRIYVVTIGGRSPVLVEVLTDAGLVGIGEAAFAYGTGAGAAAGMIKDLAEAFLLGRDPSRIEALWSEMYDHTFWAKGGGPVVFAGLSALEQALCPDVDLMVDMSAELTPDAIIRLGRALERYDPLFFEEPVDPSDRDALKKVSEHVHLPIAVGERLYTRYGFRRVLELRVADVLQPDVGNTGGIMEGKKIAAMAEAYSARVAPHNCGSPVLTAASLQLDACVPNFLIQELYPYRVPEHYEIVDRAPELEVRQSRLPLSARPGLGVELVEDAVRPFLWAECT